MLTPPTGCVRGAFFLRLPFAAVSSSSCVSGMRSYFKAASRTAFQYAASTPLVSTAMLTAAAATAPLGPAASAALVLGPPALGLAPLVLGPGSTPPGPAVSPAAVGISTTSGSLSTCCSEGASLPFASRYDASSCRPPMGRQSSHSSAPTSRSASPSASAVMSVTLSLPLRGKSRA